ncbi:hypothetical protein H8959_009339 [Pygathrix nigripes]
MQRWKAAALASVLCSSVLSIWMCREGLLLSHRLGPALVPLRRLPRTLDTRIAPPGPVPALLQGARNAVELRELTALGWATPQVRAVGRGPAARARRARSGARPCGLRELEVRVERAGPRLRIRRDGAVPLLRRRLRGRRARIRPRAATLAPGGGRACGGSGCARSPAAARRPTRTRCPSWDAHSRYHTVTSCRRASALCV